MKARNLHALIGGMVLTSCVHAFESELKRKREVEETETVTLHTTAPTTAALPIPQPKKRASLVTAVEEASQRYNALSDLERCPTEKSDVIVATQVNDYDALTVFFTRKNNLKNTKTDDRRCLATEACVFGHYCTGCRLLCNNVCDCCFFNGPISPDFSLTPKKLEQTTPPAPQRMSFSEVERIRTEAPHYATSEKRTLRAAKKGNWDHLITLFAYDKTLRDADYTIDTGEVHGLCCAAYSNCRFYTCCRLIALDLRDECLCCICCCCC